jgi:CubicO group peptidase (beta-lactamase class C family)
MTHTNSLPRSTPEAQGVPSAAVLEFLETAASTIDRLHSLMLLRHGQVIAEGWWHPYAPDERHLLFSLSKSFTSTAVGFAVEEGLLSVDDSVVSLLPDDAPAEVGANLAAMKVRHLLTMTTGHSTDALSDLGRSESSHWAKTVLEHPVDLLPGTKFVYNSGATYLLSAIVQRLTGQRVLDYLTPRLFEPLGIHGATWEQSPQGIDAGGWGLSLRTEDIARFGQLYLQGGQWGGSQVVPASWASDATRLQVPTGKTWDSADSQQGYGYQFWRSQHDAYRGDGAFGQFCIVMPDQDAVLVFTAGVPDMQQVLTEVWRLILPALASDIPLPENPAVAGELSRVLSELTIPLPVGSASSPTLEAVDRLLYEFGPNDGGVESVSVTSQGEETMLSIHGPIGEQHAVFAPGRWNLDGAGAVNGSPSRFAAAGAWSDRNTLVVQVQYYETPFAHTITLGFAEGKVEMTIIQNVSFGERRLMHGVGIARG